MTRETIYSGGHEGEAYHVEETEEGAVHLIRSTDVDDGPSRSVCISAPALLPVASALIIIAAQRARS